MSAKSPPTQKALRKQAEQKLKAKGYSSHVPPETDLKRLYHELQTYQVELEIQNEELIQAVDDLQRARDEYADLFDFSPSGYVTIDRKGLIRSANVTAAAMLETARDRLSGCPLAGFIATADRYRFLDHLDFIFREPNTTHGEEFSLHRRGGSQIQVELRCLVFRDGSHDPGLARVAMIDISDRKRTEGELARTLEDLRRSNTELEQFAYVASHDLQEPLRMVASFLRLFEKKYHGMVDDKGEEYIRYAVDGANRMQQLIDGLLSYSRLSRGEFFTRVSTAEVCRETLKNLSGTIAETAAEVTATGLPSVRGDRTQLLQLFQNLISNGLKYRRRDVPPVIRIGATRQGAEWLFSFRDNGIGIEAKDHDRVFDIFQRLHTKEEYPGTGIGLALCKRIVERHNGRIWFESAPGESSTFFFTIPIHH